MPASSLEIAIDQIVIGPDPIAAVFGREARRDGGDQLEDRQDLPAIGVRSGPLDQLRPAGVQVTDAEPAEGLAAGPTGIADKAVVREERATSTRQLGPRRCRHARAGRCGFDRRGCRPRRGVLPLRARATGCDC
jgi:hypothetical protein